MRRTHHALALLSGLFLLLAVSGCGPKVDGPPMIRTVFWVSDASPKSEPLSRIGNKPYTVFGKTYHPISSSKGYREVGTASWYGTKFHGRATSSGEEYDLYGMTAAHKTLPLPTYVRVTNLKNGRDVIVKVNDRGPFHGDRLIDLSYAAARKLGMDKTGTAKVRIEAIDPEEYNRGFFTRAVNTLFPDWGDVYVQVGAFQKRHNAAKVVEKLSDIPNVAIEKRGDYYKVLVGPFSDKQQAEAIQSRIAAKGFREPRVVTQP